MRFDRSKLPAYANDPAVFRADLLVDCGGGVRPFGESMDERQDRDFREMDRGWIRAAGGHAEGGPSRGYQERPRGSSKTTDMAVMLLWSLLFANRPLSAVAAAVDRAQGRLLRNAVLRLSLLNPWVRKMGLDVQHSTIVNQENGSELEIVSSDVESSYGRVPHIVLCDELCHWRNEDLWHSLLSSAGKREDALLLCISNAGFKLSWQWKLRESIREDAKWYFSRWEKPAKWISEGTIEEQKRLLPAPVFDRLWGNVWNEGATDCLTANDVEAAATLDRPMEWEPGWAFVAGLDLGLKKDHTGLCVLGRHVGSFRRREVEPPQPKSFLDAALVDCGLMAPPAVEHEEEFESIPGTGRMKLAYINSWKPPRGGMVDLDDVGAKILELHQRFGLRGVWFDPTEALYLSQKLRRAGVPMVETPFTQSSLSKMAGTLIEAFQSRLIEITRDESLLTDLKRLRIVETTNGVRLTSPRVAGEGHGDKATALTLALYGASQIRAVPVITRPLLHEGITPADCLQDAEGELWPAWAES